MFRCNIYILEIVKSNNASLTLGDIKNKNKINDFIDNKQEQSYLFESDDEYFSHIRE